MEDALKSTQARLVVVAAEFNQPLVDAMIAAATEQARDGGASIVEVVRVSGCYEVPLITQQFLTRRDVDAVVVLGFIERGETQHGEVMGHVVHAKLVTLQIETGKPIGIGIIGPGATEAQAQARKIDYAKAAVKAALNSLEILRRPRRATASGRRRTRRSSR